MSVQSDLIGSWLVTATDHEPPEHSLSTFHVDGTIVTSPPPVVPPFGPSAEPLYTSAGHGMWANTDPDSGVGTFVVLIADRHGNPHMTVTVHARITIGDDRQSWTGKGVRSFADPAGNPIATQPAVVSGRRILAIDPDTATDRAQTTAPAAG